MILINAFYLKQKELNHSLSDLLRLKKSFFFNSSLISQLETRFIAKHCEDRSNFSRFSYSDLGFQKKLDWKTKKHLIRGSLSHRKDYTNIIMGVKGLLSFVQKCPDACKYVSIEKMAYGHRLSFNCVPILVVDGSNFIPSLYADQNNSLERIYGGQWLQFKEILEEFVLKCKNIGIKLVFIFDGTTCEEKLPEWAKRRMDKYNEIASIFHKISLYLEENVVSCNQGASTLKFLAKLSLKELGVEMYQTDKKLDPDNYIVGYANRNKAVFAVMSDDSDFIIFDTKPVLSTSHLKLHQMETRMYDRHCLANRYLNISTIQLPLFACLMGNDFVPLQKLKQFHQRLVNDVRIDKEVKIKKLCILIKKRNWIGKIYDKQELFSISYEVFHNGNEYALLKRGLKSYVITKAATPMTFCVQMHPDFEKAVHERHFNCSNACIFDLLCKKQYKSSEVLEDASRKASALVYREIRQRCYGVLFNCFVEPSKVKSIVIQERCWYKKNFFENNDLNEPETIHPLPLRRISEVIKIEDLWFNCSEEIRFEYFWRLLQIPMDFELLIKLPEDEVVLSCILNYLIGGLKSGPLLKPLDVAVFVAQALWKPSALALKKLKNPEVHSEVVNLSTLFVIGIRAVLMALETCGFTSPYKYATPWRFFDGKLFHHLYNEAKMRPKVRALCNNQDEIIERFYRLLTIVTDNTEYDPVRFDWRNVLKDFELE